MRQILNFFLQFATRRQLAYTIAAVMVVAGTLLIFLLVREKAWRRLIVIIVMMFVLGFFAKTIPLPEERFHLLEFFLVGYLGADDGRHAAIFRRVIFALLLSVSVPALDEGLQYFIPWRVADWRDVGFGFVGASCGVLFNCLYYPLREA